MGAVFATLLLSCLILPAQAQPDARPESHPIWIAADNSGAIVWVADREGRFWRLGSDGEVQRKGDPLQQVAAAIALTQSDQLLAVDGRGGWQLRSSIDLSILGQGATTCWIDQLVANPIDESLPIAASTWGRCLLQLELQPRSPAPAQDTSQAIHVRSRLDLNFCPGALASHSDGRYLVVAEKFGGRLALVDVTSWLVVSEVAINGHNIGGLAVSPDGESLAISHQWLSEVPATQEHLVNGDLIQNRLTLLPWNSLLGDSPKAMDAADSIDLDRLCPGGSADPGQLTFVANDQLIILARGSHRVLWISIHPANLLGQWNLGMRPVMFCGDSGDRWWVACQFSNDVFAISRKRAPQQSQLGPSPATRYPLHAHLSSEEGVGSGELLFYDARLSATGRLSCHSCHTDGHSNQQLADTLGDGGYGAPKLTPTLLGTSLSDPWGWLGNVKELSDQVHQSVASTLHGQITARQRSALVAYLFQLDNPPTVEQARGVNRATTATGETQTTAGREVFVASGCANCHIAPLTYTTNGVFDVGLVDAVGNQRFNPPSLKGVSQRDRFLHDGRARSLEEVLIDQGHSPGTDLTTQQVTDLVEFLKTL